MFNGIASKPDYCINLNMKAYAYYNYCCPGPNLILVLLSLGLAINNLAQVVSLQSTLFVKIEAKIMGE